MSTNDSSDSDHIQELEMEFLFSIYDHNQNHCLLEYDKLSRCGSFTFYPQYNKPIQLYGPFINIKLKNNNPIECLSNTINQSYCYDIQYLPIIIMKFILPFEYPKSIPRFIVSSIWLPLSILNELTCKLIEIANNHLGEMTLLPCIDYLQNEYIYYFIERFQQNLQLNSFDLFKFYHDYKLELNLSIHDLCYLLLSNNNDRIYIEFNESYIECNVCFEIKKGKLFKQFIKCKCLICQNCIIESFKLSINESLFNGPLKCLQCGDEVNYTEIRYILPEDIYKKYESLVLKRGLDIMPDIVYCPRPQCEFPVILDSENLGRCPK
ncbi:unnamed protein product [Schistosoma spindalis]|nr:unnamed protein product [Schistosoma spindale]